MSTQSIYVVFTALHIGAGSVALIVAPVAMIVRKGGKAHRQWGRVFFWAMFAVFVSALGLLAISPSVFLFVLSILSFYAVFSGVRALRRKRPERGEEATWLDRFGAVAAILTGLSFILWGVLPLLNIYANEIPASFALLGVAFGVLLAQMGWEDLRGFGKPPRERNWWWYYHMGRMTGGYIAAATAFIVQVVGPLLPASLDWTAWAVPSVVGSVLVRVWIERYRRKFAAASEETGATSAL